MYGENVQIVPIPVERKNRDAKDNVPVPIFTNWTNHTMLNTLQQTKDVAFHTQVGVVNPEQKQLHEVRCKQRRLLSEQDTNALQGPPDKSCHFKSTQIDVGLYITEVMCSVFS